MNIQKEGFLEVAIEAAREAEEVILKYYESGVRATLKPDQSPVTIADQETEQAIIETIRAKFPDHGFLGEETGESASRNGRRLFHRGSNKRFIARTSTFLFQMNV